MKVHELFTLFKVCSSIGKNVLLSLCLGNKKTVFLFIFFFSLKPVASTVKREVIFLVVSNPTMNEL
jgi:hypothetical protein